MPPGVAVCGPGGVSSEVTPLDAAGPGPASGARPADVALNSQIAAMTPTTTIAATAMSTRFIAGVSAVVLLSSVMGIRPPPVPWQCEARSSAPPSHFTVHTYARRARG